MPKRTKNLQSTNWSLLGWASVVIFLIIHLIFNDLGLIKMFELKSKKNELHVDIQKLKIEIEEKTQVANMLVNDFEYIEKIAREQFRMVKKGEKVERGQKIGEMGNTGKSTAPHLHYEVQLHRKPKNPNKYLFDISSYN